MTEIITTGNKAASNAVKVSDVDVVAAYPITPQTDIVKEIATFVSEGEMEAQYVPVESEHSALSACISASATGARTFTATSANGLALMHEMLHWAVGARTPVVMNNVDRAMAPPWSIYADQQDSISQRDVGWLQSYCMSNQEVLDSVIMAFRIAEELSLPMMNFEDAFILSHTSEIVDVPSKEKVKEFLPPYEPEYKLDPEDPRSFGELAFPEDYYEFRYKIKEAHDEAREFIPKVHDEFEEMFGRSYDMIEEYRTEDADVVFITAGTLASEAMRAIDELRDEGIKIGLGRIRIFRPFPINQVLDLARRVDVIGAIDRSFTFGQEGAFAHEIRGVLQGTDAADTLVKSFISGIGGKDVTYKHLMDLGKNLKKIKEKGELDERVQWTQLKE